MPRIRSGCSHFPAGSTLRKLEERVNDFLDFGVELIWIIDPQGPKAWIATRGQFTESGPRLEALQQQKNPHGKIHAGLKRRQTNHERQKANRLIVATRPGGKRVKSLGNAEDRRQYSDLQRR